MTVDFDSAYIGKTLEKNCYKHTQQLQLTHLSPYKTRNEITNRNQELPNVIKPHKKQNTVHCLMNSARLH